MPLTVGQEIYIPCEIQSGAFPTERLVTIDTLEGTISGFVRKEDVKLGEGHHGSVRARLKEIQHDHLVVMLKGSFFTTNGLARVSPELRAA